MHRSSLLVCSIAFATVHAWAQDDAEGCKDHPLLTRMPNFHISECSENYNALDVRMALGETNVQNVEGTVTRIHYIVDETDAKRPSPLQVVRNYENAVKAKGGKTVYVGPANGFDDIISGTFAFATGGIDYTVVVREIVEWGPSEVGEYSLFVVAKEAMKQDVEAAQMFEAISTTGSVALYINFATGKADIEPSSQATVQQLANMLTANPALNVSVEGHTDNTGTPEGNKALSEKRAAAVVKALVAQGIAVARLSSKGWGQEKPLADNGSEEGRAKNRRVEVVKK